MSAHLAALRTLHDICARMELEQEATRPTEAEYQAAMRVAAALVAKATASSSTTAVEVEKLRADFERLANKNAACGLTRSRRGTYVNPAIARDWKWFELGAISKSTGSAQ